MIASRNLNTEISNPFHQRREKVLKQYGADDIIILVSAPESHRNADTNYIFRQDSNFYYITGFSEPRSVAILAPGRAEGEYILFNLPRDPDKEIWNGKRAGQKGAVEEFGANQAFSIEELDQRLPDIIRGRKNAYLIQSNAEKGVENRVMLKKVSEAGMEVRDITPLLTAMRSIKDEAEILAMREALRITGLAHVNAMRHCQPGMFEYQVEAALMNKFYQNGSHAQAYPNIVASGPNTCILHYETNDRRIQNGDLVLIDAAAEYQTYAADITRTFPANGKFTIEQRAIYEIVLKAQEAGIKAVAAGVTVKSVRDAVERVITQGLLDLGLLHGELEKLLEEYACKKYYMHSFGHWIGLDVHDVGGKDENGQPNMRQLEAGMTLTMEPGIYISNQHNDIDPKWHNIGVRIEDVLFVTSGGCEVLSAAIPKSVESIEMIMEQARLHRQHKHGLFAATRAGKVGANDQEYSRQLNITP
jgi:Xaa-Pro aminopeptidase